jgi:hypothetical protein
MARFFEAGNSLIVVTHWLKLFLNGRMSDLDTRIFANPLGALYRLTVDPSGLGIFLFIQHRHFSLATPAPQVLHKSIPSCKAKVSMLNQLLRSIPRKPQQIENAFLASFRLRVIASHRIPPVAPTRWFSHVPRKAIGEKSKLAHGVQFYCAANASSRGGGESVVWPCAVWKRPADRWLPKRPVVPLCRKVSPESKRQFRDHFSRRRIRPSSIPNSRNHLIRGIRRQRCHVKPPPGIEMRG